MGVTQSKAKASPQHGTSVDEQDSDGVSRLMRASANGDTQTVKSLLDEGAQVNLKDNKGASALHYACTGGLALHDIADWDADRIMLVIPHLNDPSDTVKVLLDHGAQVDLQMENGWFALMVASGCGFFKTVHMLLDHGAQVDLQNEDGGSALRAASYYGHPEVVRVLLDRGAQVDLQKEDGGSALMGASYYGHLEVVRVLLDRGAQVDLQKEDGGSALMGASYYGHLEVVRVLLDRGAQVDLQKEDGGSALMVASYFGHTEVVRVLLDRGAQAGLQDEYGNSALKQAQDKGHHEVIQLLLDHGAGDKHGSHDSAASGPSEHDKPVKLPQRTDSEIRQEQPPSSSLTLPNAFRELLPLASEWQNIGTLLEIPPGTLEDIKSNNPHRVKDCLREMLTEWLKTTDPHPTWENLAEAIHPFNQIKAMEIRHKYCTTLTS